MLFFSAALKDSKIKKVLQNLECVKASANGLNFFRLFFASKVFRQVVDVLDRLADSSVELCFQFVQHFRVNFVEFKVAVDFEGSARMVAEEYDVYGSIRCLRDDLRRPVRILKENGIKVLTEVVEKLFLRQQAWPKRPRDDARMAEQTNRTVVGSSLRNRRRTLPDRPPRIQRL